MHCIVYIQVGTLNCTNIDFNKLSSLDILVISFHVFNGNNCTNDIPCIKLSVSNFPWTFYLFRFVHRLWSSSGLNGILLGFSLSRISSWFHICRITQQLLNGSSLWRIWNGTVDVLLQPDLCQGSDLQTSEKYEVCRLELNYIAIQDSKDYCMIIASFFRVSFFFMIFYLIRVRTIDVSVYFQSW